MGQAHISLQLGVHRMECRLSRTERTTVNLNDFGFFQLSELPTQLELLDYYKNKYYQKQLRTHRTEYSPDEIRYRRNKLKQKHHIYEGLVSEANSTGKSFLDVGAGEGFAMKYFQELGWNVLGIDYSSHACMTHHPELIEDYLNGDVLESLLQLQQRSKRFDLILLDNVLEHMLDPLDVLKITRSLLTKDGILIIEVPNDFSLFQKYLLDNKKISSEFWVVSPDHINYFNRQGLRKLVESAGFQELTVVGDFPIDLFLFNEHTNYVSNKAVGRSCHQARLDIENLIHATSLDKSIELFKCLADLGIGRQILGFYKSNIT